jgi:Baseplate J-like protein
MVTIRTTNDLVLALLDYYKVSMPDASMNPGSVIRDLFVDAPSSQIALLYDELSKISNLQSLRLVSGNDLDRLAQNLGLTRRAATASSGIALFTFASLPAVVAINTGDTVTGNNGATFTVVNGISVNPAQANSYQSIAVQYQNNLNFLNITDPYAVQVSVQAATPGVAGNIPQYTLNSSSTPGVSNVTNISPFTGGANQEDDATFRNRVLGIFSGSNIGTALGYQNTALSNSLVNSAAVIGPGNPLMTRDGTVVENINGVLTIISAGTGGKVNIVIDGESESMYTDTYIYQDQSNMNDPTSPSNNHVLGQIAADAGLTVTQKRVVDIANGVLPAQPVDQILSVTGSLSGPNFIPQTINSLGISSGNYTLVKDTGVYSGSPWGFDAFAWTSNQIVYNENLVKSQFNGQDPTSFSGVLQIPSVQQNISISNENSQVLTSNQSIIQLLHVPATNVTRVYNVNTGERYTVTNQNLNGTGSINTTGQIQISGSTLPLPSNILQVDYTWIVSYDPFSDYDGKILKDNPGSPGDSVDWSIANAIRRERVLFTLNPTNTLYIGTVKHIVSSIVTANIFSTTNGIVSPSVVANFSGRSAVVLSGLAVEINTIETMTLQNTNEEVYITAQNNGTIINTATVINNQLRYNVTIILPTDAPAAIGSAVNVVYNQSDVSTSQTASASFVGNQITIPVSNVPITPASLFLDTTYITGVQDITSVGITNFPISRSGNGFTLNSNTGPLNAIPSNTMRRENHTIQQNGSNLYVDLNVTSSGYNMTPYQVVSVIDLRNDAEIWNAAHPGTLTTDPNNNNSYQLIFSGYNSPELGDNVLVIYFADDQLNVQPFTYFNRVFSRAFETLETNFSTNDFYIPINNFTLEAGLSFSIIDTTTGLSIGGGSDGYIVSTSSNSLVAIFDSISFNFSSVSDILGKNITITSSSNANNLGTFNILSHNATFNTINIGVVVSNLTQDQISIVRLADGKDLWNTSTGTIDPINNLLSIPLTTAASAGDKVMAICFTNKNLHQAPTKIAVTTSDQVNNTGVVTVYGTVITEVAKVVFTATQAGLTQNVLFAIQTFLGTTSTTAVTSNMYIVRLMQLEKVSVASGNQVLSTLATYDVDGTAINNNLFYANEMIYNELLSNIEFTLPSTTNNLNNAPQIGDTLQITFYYATDGYAESLYFTRNGTLYTNGRFALVDQAYISSGFTASQSTTFRLAYFTQPSTGSRYAVNYNYLAPKENERIVIQYNYNALITDVTFLIEANRPITADVLVIEDQDLLINVTATVTVQQNTSISPSIVLQNVENAIVATINSGTLGGTLSFGQIVSAAQGVSGVANVQIILFNQQGVAGTATTITAQENQQFVANTILVNPGTS